MVQLVIVEPVGGAWLVRADAIGFSEHFQNGRDAELAAKALATKIEASGSAAEIEIFLRGGALAGRFVWPPTPRNARQITPSASQSGTQITQPVRNLERLLTV